MKRPLLITLLLVSVAGIGYRIADHNSWIVVTRGDRAVDTGAEPSTLQSVSQWSLLVVGDTGKDTANRSRVIQAMEEHSSWSHPDAAILLGDNFYEEGVSSVADPRFDLDFEALFKPDRFNFPFYVCLGNHDYGGNTDAQVHYTQQSNRWRMPATYFKTQQPLGSQTVDLFVIDTVALARQTVESHAQLVWLDHELAASDATWKLVAGHHPVITGGDHEVSPPIAAALAPLFSRYKIDLYLSGHDHDLQLCDSERGWLQVISGSGSKLRSTSWIDQTIFAKAVPGFCWVLLTETQMDVTFYSADKRLFTHSVTKRHHPGGNHLGAAHVAPCQCRTCSTQSGNRTR